MATAKISNDEDMVIMVRENMGKMQVGMLSFFSPLPVCLINPVS